MNDATQYGAGTYRGTEHLTESEYHNLLAAERRRTVLDILATSPASVDLEQLATAVAARENDVNVTDESAVDLVTLDLHHIHLPKMDALEVIDYDPTTTRVGKF